MRHFNYKRDILLFVLLTVWTLSCRKFVQIETAPDLIQSDLVFTTDNTALSAANGVYVALRLGTTSFFNAGFTVNGGLAADELYATTPTTNTDAFYLNQLTPLNSLSNGYYTNLYQIVYKTNSILEGVQKSRSLSDSLSRQLTGEMKFIRALAYFYLTNLWGDVALVTSTDYRDNAVLPRTPAKDVYKQIITDLKDAQTLLKETYPSAGKARPNKWTATLLLARVYIYCQDWINAETQATAVIHSGIYDLVPGTSIGNVFLKNSVETVWELAPSNEAVVVGDAVSFVPFSSTARPTYALTPTVLTSFDSGDKRYGTTGWVAKNVVSGQEYVYPAKYKQRVLGTGGMPSEYKIVLRLAEAYLLRAEARANQDNMIGAQEDINKIRSRADLPNTNANTKTLLLKAIEKERQAEFFAEWGHRWLDLKRWGRATDVLGPLKGNNWQSTDVLWPIPEKELLYNPLLTQNSGY